MEVMVHRYIHNKSFPRYLERIHLERDLAVLKRGAQLIDGSSLTPEPHFSLHKAWKGIRRSRLPLTFLYLKQLVLSEAKSTEKIHPC